MNRFEFHNHRLTLHPEAAVLVEETGDLVVADLHLGKAAAFRARGIPVPEGDNERDLGRLLALVRETGAARLIVAGDLFHAPAGITPELVAALDGFLATLGVPFVLVRGNHEEKLKCLPCGFDALPEFRSGGIRIVHDPRDVEGHDFHLAGHWHPIVKIKDGKRTWLRLQSFLLRGNLLVLPSFGGFTGGAVIDMESGDRAFVPLRDRVVEVPI